MNYEENWRRHRGPFPSAGKTAFTLFPVLVYRLSTVSNIRGSVLSRENTQRRPMLDPPALSLDVKVTGGPRVARTPKIRIRGEFRFDVVAR